MTATKTSTASEPCATCEGVDLAELEAPFARAGEPVPVPFAVGVPLTSVLTGWKLLERCFLLMCSFSSPSFGDAVAGSALTEELLPASERDFGPISR